MAHNEWYTPPEIVASAREVLGRIDLDPCSTALANDVVRAETIFTATHDALDDTPWSDRIDRHGIRAFMNPPYTRDVGTASPFIDRMVSEWEGGGVSQAIVLVNASTGTQWFFELFRFPLCFVGPGRIKFNTPTNVDTTEDSDRAEQLAEYAVALDEGSSPRYDSALAYLPPFHETANAVYSFVDEFTKHGHVTNLGGWI